MALAATIYDTAWKQRLRRRLRGWYETARRDLPWRETRDPYRIWVSEIMLQQTQVATVIPYYERFLARFPDVESLAAANESEVLKLWEGLGYYRRARQLHRAAKTIVDEHGGQVPTDAEQLQSLPGIGRYTAGAILSIARDARLPILEANTLRLLCRLIGYRGDPRAAAGQRILWETAEAILPRREVGDFNQALMELGGEVCKPTTPACDTCALESLCMARQQGAEGEIPQKARRPNFESVHEALVVIERRGQILILQRGDDERWAGMWDFVRFPLDARSSPAVIAAEVEAVVGIGIGETRHFTTIEHGVTRFRITLECHRVQAAPRQRPRSTHAWRWVRAAELAELPLSVTARKVANLLATTRSDDGNAASRRSRPRARRRAASD